MLAWMQDQAAITNEWAADDRAREVEVFRPARRLHPEAPPDSAARKNEAAQQAVADVRQQTTTPRRAASGRPWRWASIRTGLRFMVNTRPGLALDAGLAAAGARNAARRRVEQEAEGKRANAINMGAGLAVNPGTSMGLSNGALQAGGSAAMAGQPEQGSLLNTQYNQQLQSWQANRTA